jgi:hypothetical protein
MDITGNPWVVYPGDVPTKVGFENSPDAAQRGPVGIKRVVWRNPTDTRMTAGSVASLKDGQDRIVFNRVWPEDTAHDFNEICAEVCHVYTGLYCDVLEGGALEIWIE